MPVGICQMCLGKDKQLVRSHLLPAALYNYCRKPEMEPIRVTSEIVMSTSRQTQDYLLCHECESVLNEGGEKWMVGKFAKPDRVNFALFEMITRVVADIDEEDVKVYSGINVPELDADKMVHFAMGLFWKASVHSWTKDKLESAPLEFGPYREPIRKYLLGEGAFPGDMALSVSISTPEKAMIVIMEPYEGRNKKLGFRTHFCYVLGVLFALSVGRQVAPEQRAACFASNTNHPIWVMENLHMDFENKLRAVYAKAPKSRKLIEAKKGWAAQNGARKSSS